MGGGGGGEKDVEHENKKQLWSALKKIRNKLKNTQKVQRNTIY